MHTYTLFIINSPLCIQDPIQPRLLSLRSYSVEYKNGAPAHLWSLLPWCRPPSRWPPLWLPRAEPIGKWRPTSRGHKAKEVLCCQATCPCPTTLQEGFCSFLTTIKSRQVLLHHHQQESWQCYGQYVCFKTLEWRRRP